MIEMLSFDPDMLLAARQAGGSYCYIAWNPEIEAALKSLYGRDGLCLKIFGDIVGKCLEDFEWTHSPVFETARIQNLFALYGLAPMVYRIVFLNGRQLAQVTEYARDEGRSDVFLVKTLIEKYALGTRNLKDDGTPKWDFRFSCNWKGGWFVDFGGWYFK